MAAIGIGAPIYAGIQALLSGYVYREAKHHDRRSPLILAGTTFVFGIAAAIVMSGILLVLVVQAIALVLYLAAQARTGSLAEP
ncbi:sporulation control protein [Natrinema sp. SYSU A 869]|uniref:sporulation control protein n=1 Tax=Natrinema sp. SYSU A 869 TaxID=2871694 RepID=UPI001CA394F8|nr:sporulation control protein [Natrinema sp. SYSU A 869]